MLLGAVLVLLAGVCGCLVAALRWSGGGDLSPLFENSLLIALGGLVLTVLATMIEASRQALRLAGWLLS